MLEQIIMPKLGDASGDCWLEEWKKSIGERVEMGEVICVAAIDKAAFDIESPYDGILAEILVQPHVIVAPGTPIGRIEVTEEPLT
jgi:pyruvate dehydrogenase E2 component (dihydrolipoamide acetyltransferase)